MRAFILLLALALVGCGFHLRGTGLEKFPPDLTALRVAVQGSRAAHDSLKIAVQVALRQQANVQVVDAGEAPLLTLTETHFENQVLSVNSAGLGREYLLRYEVSYRLTDTSGKERIARDTVRVLREQLVEPAAVLARENEDRELRESMRTEAAHQIVRRLARALSLGTP